jgi:hypothetical protein
MTVYIDVLCTFVTALGADELDRRFIIAVELDWMDVFARYPICFNSRTSQVASLAA